MIDPWYLQYIKQLKYPNLIKFTDKEAYKKFKEDRWVYDRCKLSKKLENEVYDLSKELPKKYPVIVKPRINFYGMGKGAYRAYSEKDIISRQGMVAQPFYAGEHITIDLAFYKGVFVDSFSFLAHKDKNGSFELFESIEPQIWYPLEVFRWLKKGSFILNVEVIDRYVIEAHLRPSMQYFDISGGLVSKFVQQLGDDVSVADYKSSVFEKTYSKVIRIDKDLKIKRFPEVKIPKGVRSIQYCWEIGKSLSDFSQDEKSFRLAVLNGQNLDILNELAEKVKLEILKNS